MNAQRKTTDTLRDLAALAKPRITLLVLFTTAGGIWLAHGEGARLRTLLTLVGTCLAVAAANTLNCYLERDIDRHMARTRGRPLPDGRLAPETALWYGLALACVSIPVLALGVNVLTAVLGLIALVSYVLVYTPMKQRSPKALLVGAVPGALPPLMGWTSVTGKLTAQGLVLFAILFFWQLPHFLAIGIFRKDDYARAGFKILPVVKGDRATQLHIAVYALILVATTLLLVPLHVAGMGYLVVAAITGATFLVWSLSGLRPAAGTRWARGLFLASLVYLTVLFAALALDAL